MGSTYFTMSLETLDFTRCFFCLSDSLEDLTSPVNKKISKERENVNPYTSIAGLILKFHDIKQYPYDHDIPQLNSFPGGLENLLHIKNAKYHRICRQKFSSEKLTTYLYTYVTCTHSKPYIHMNINSSWRDVLLDTKHKDHSQHCH